MKQNLLLFVAAVLCFYSIHSSAQSPIDDIIANAQKKQTTQKQAPAPAKTSSSNAKTASTRSTPSSQPISDAEAKASAEAAQQAANDVLCAPEQADRRKIKNLRRQFEEAFKHLQIQ